MASRSYEAPDICAECGGECCKHAPGSFLPSDFSVPIADSLLAALRNGSCSLYRWHDQDDILTYIVRPALKGVPDLIATQAGECTYLRSDGCLLPLAVRPTECRTYEPQADGDCVDHGPTNDDAAIAWLPHQPLIESIVSQLGGTVEDHS